MRGCFTDLEPVQTLNKSYASLLGRGTAAVMMRKPSDERTPLLHAVFRLNEGPSEGKNRFEEEIRGRLSSACHDR